MVERVVMRHRRWCWFLALLLVSSWFDDAWVPAMIGDDQDELTAENDDFLPAPTLIQPKAPRGVPVSPSEGLTMPLAGPAWAALTRQVLPKTHPVAYSRTCLLYLFMSLQC
jgi:hypothetical protein